MAWITRVYLLLVLIFLPLEALAMPASTPVVQGNSTSRLVADGDALAPGAPIWLALEMRLAPQWHTYWQNPGDTGMPTALKWTLPEGFAAGDVQWPAPHRLEIAGLMNFVYEDTVYFPVLLTPPATLNQTEYTIQLTATWLVCKDICIPEKGEYSLTLPVAPPTGASHLNSALQRLPKSLDVRANWGTDGDMMTLRVPAHALQQYRGAPVELYPLTEGIITHIAPQETVWASDTVQVRVKRGLGQDTPPLDALLVVSDGAHRPAFAIRAHYDAATALQPARDTLSLPWALLLAFAGGLILNLMPCVLPILSLKALALVKKSAAGRRESTAHGLAYTAGILLSFAVIAIALIALQQAGSAVGWGFQLQSPAFVAVLALITFAVGLNLSGVFNLPHLFGNAGNALAARHGLPGTFFTGALAVLVATPCTAPFMAPALGFALTQPPLASFLVFQALALGFAAPLLLVSLSPKLLALMPKPGAWMHGFKQLMAFPMYATSAWLLWVLTRQGGPEALAEGLTLLVAAAFLLWLHERVKSRTRTRLWNLGILLFAMALGWMLFSGPGKLPEVVEEPFSTERIAQLRTEGTPLFVYGTASWCITCKINEASSLRTHTVMEHFKRQGIVVMKADWTNQDDTIAAYLHSFDRQGVPIYVFYPKDGKEPRLLPQLLTPYLVVEQTQP